MIDSNHPRATSLKTREKIVKGVELGLTSINGLVAQGRGEAFDYLLGEKTNSFANEAITASAALLLLANHPVLCVNGNTAALIPKEYVQLAKLLDCQIEVNLFHRTLKREQIIQEYLKKLGAKNIVGIGKNASKEMKHIASNRKFVSPQGIAKADVVFVPLEDGDRVKALVRVGKKVIAVDLNPLSRTAKTATITIVDNIVRGMPFLIKEVRKLKSKKRDELEKIVKSYSNKKTLLAAEKEIRKIS